MALLNTLLIFSVMQAIYGSFFLVEFSLKKIWVDSPTTTEFSSQYATKFNSSILTGFMLFAWFRINLFTDLKNS